MFSLRLDEIDVHRIGTWPAYVKVAIMIVACALIGMFCNWLFISSKASQLEELKAEETRLKQFFASKQNSLIDIKDYKQQMDMIEQRLAKLVQRLPGDNELPNLINQVSQAGQDSGLAINEIKILDEKKFKYYVELPIKIQVEGNYNQIGNFISDVSGMSRVITFHDFSLENVKNEKPEEAKKLKMELLAKTYRYVAPKDDEDDESNNNTNTDQNNAGSHTDANSNAPGEPKVEPTTNVPS